MAGERFSEGYFLSSVFASLNDAATCYFGLMAIAQLMRIVVRPEVLVAGYRPDLPFVPALTVVLECLLYKKSIERSAPIAADGFSIDSAILKPSR